LSVSLLKRLREMKADPLEQPTAKSRTERGVASVREDVLLHLRQICATRFGSSPSVPNLGLPDLTDIFHGGVKK